MRDRDLLDSNVRRILCKIFFERDDKMKIKEIDDLYKLYIFWKTTYSIFL